MNCDTLRGAEGKGGKRREEGWGGGGGVASIVATEKHPLIYQMPQSVHMVRNCGAQTLPLTMHYGGKKNWW